MTRRAAACALAAAFARRALADTPPAAKKKGQEQPKSLRLTPNGLESELFLGPGSDLTLTVRGIDHAQMIDMMLRFFATKAGPGGELEPLKAVLENSGEITFVITTSKKAGRP